MGRLRNGSERATRAQRTCKLIHGDDAERIEKYEEKLQDLEARKHRMVRQQREALDAHERTRAQRFDAPIKTMDGQIAKCATKLAALREAAS